VGGVGRQATSVPTKTVRHTENLVGLVTTEIENPLVADRKDRDDELLDSRRVVAKASEMTEQLEWIFEFTSSMVLT